MLHKSLQVLTLMAITALTTTCCVGQEICNNGIDDDGDGLIDLHDPDCQCRFDVINNLLQNGSFESFDHCPTTYIYNTDYNIASYWQFGVRYNEADFYHNLTCTYDSQQVMLYMPPKLPLPDGTGFTSIMNSAYIDPIPENQMLKTYISQCLQSPLKSGNEYTLSFYAGRFKSWDDPASKIFPFTVAVFGSTNCGAVPFGRANVQGNGCPSNYNGWMLLGKTSVTSNGAWVESKVTFTAPSDISVLEIGPDCSILSPIADLSDSTTYLDYYMYYLDDLHLLPTKDFPFQYIQVQAGTGCNQNAPVLVAPVVANASYQWYQDSVAIAGATDATYQIPALTKSSYYNVFMSTPGKCTISEPFLATPDYLSKINIPPDTSVCGDTPVILGQPIDGITYRCNGSEGPVVTVSGQGDYSIVATDVYKCQRTFNVHVTQQNCGDCDLFVPSAFTPNSDGVNDVFKARLSCLVSHFSFQIFDRWGQKVFESRDSNAGWDGTYLEKKLMSDVYVYFISYKTSSNVTKTARGTVTLIR